MREYGELKLTTIPVQLSLLFRTTGVNNHWQWPSSLLRMHCELCDSILIYNCFIKQLKIPCRPKLQYCKCGWDLNFTVRIYNFLTTLSLMSEFSGPSSSSMRIQGTCHRHDRVLHPQSQILARFDLKEKRLECKLQWQKQTVCVVRMIHS